MPDGSTAAAAAAAAAAGPAVAVAAKNLDVKMVGILKLDALIPKSTMMHLTQETVKYKPQITNHTINHKP